MEDIRRRRREEAARGDMSIDRPVYAAAGLSARIGFMGRDLCKRLKTLSRLSHSP